MLFMWLVFLRLATSGAWSMSEAVHNDADAGPSSLRFMQQRVERVTHGSETVAQPVFQSNNSNLDQEAGPFRSVPAMMGQLKTELEYELHAPANGPHSKVTLAIVTVLGLGVCGIDRCCMGQCFIGIM